MRRVAGPDPFRVRLRLLVVEVLGAAGICAVLAAVGVLADQRKT